MRQLLMKVEYLCRSSLYIGKVAEDKATQVVIDTTYWKELYPDLRIEIVYERPDKVSYPLEIVEDETTVTWTVERKDLALVGTGGITVIGYEEEKKAISTTGLCFIAPGLNGLQKDEDYSQEVVPTGWIQEIVDMKNKVEEIAKQFPPLATDKIIGGVLSSLEDDKVKVNEDGTMSLNRVSTSLLYVPEGEEFILNGGDSDKGVE